VTPIADSFRDLFHVNNIIPIVFVLSLLWMFSYANCLFQTIIISSTQYFPFSWIIISDLCQPENLIYHHELHTHTDTHYLVSLKNTLRCGKRTEINLFQSAGRRSHIVKRIVDSSQQPLRTQTVCSHAIWESGSICHSNCRMNTKTRYPTYISR